MKISGTVFNLNHHALEVYLSGCDGACEGCHNPELWDFEVGVDVELAKEGIFKKIKDNELVGRVWVMGGEPLLQDPDELAEFLLEIKCAEPKIETWVWTRFHFIPDDIKKWVDFAKVGEYNKSLRSYVTDYGIELASSNQKIIKV